MQLKDQQNNTVNFHSKNTKDVLAVYLMNGKFFISPKGKTTFIMQKDISVKSMFVLYKILYELGRTSTIIQLNKDWLDVIAEIRKQITRTESYKGISSLPAYVNEYVRAHDLKLKKLKEMIK